MVKKICALAAAIILLGAVACMGGVAGEPLYKGVSVVQFLGGPRSDVVEAFGSKLSYDDYFEGARCCGYNDEILFFFDVFSDETLAVVVTKPNTLELSGIKLHMDREELVKVFGLPDEEEASYNEMDDEKAYIYTYHGRNYLLKFTMYVLGEKVRNIRITPSPWQ